MFIKLKNGEVFESKLVTFIQDKIRFTSDLKRKEFPLNEIDIIAKEEVSTKSLFTNSKKQVG